MTRTGPLLLVTCVLACTTAAAQTRDAYQQVYRDWQQDSENIERDAAHAGKDLPPRAEKAAADAGKFIATRKAFYEGQPAELIQKLKTLEPLELPVDADSVKSAEANLAPQEKAVASSFELFGGDTDIGIQRLRQALEKERQTLIVLRNAVETRERAMETAKMANDRVDHASAEAIAQVKAISESFAESAQIADRLAEAWPFYYRALSDGAQGLQITDPLPASLGTLTNVNSSTDLLTSRFLGSWNFVFGVSTYTGISPFSFDVFVREQGGEIYGTVNARFIVGANADSGVIFSFSGPLQATRSQSFAVRTPDGANGTVELIPGAANNLLEVNFHLDGAAGKVQESDVVLVKH